MKKAFAAIRHNCALAETQLVETQLVETQIVTASVLPQKG
jgi:hypothetical protein